MLLEQKHENKLSTRYEPEPYMVRNKVGNQVKMEGKNGGELKRNIIHVKKYEEKNNTGQTDVNRDDTSIEAMPSEPIVRPKRDTKPPKYLKGYVTT